MIQTKNFNPEIDVMLKCTCSHILCDKRSVNQQVLNMAQQVRNDIRKPLTVNSGGRCQYHPDEIHRATPADHQNGCGIDIAVQGGEMRGQLVEMGLDYGFNAIGVAKNFVHLGFREDCKLVMWVY